MPVNDRYPLRDVLAACRAYYERKRRMVFVEYVMLAGVNDSYAQARQLAEVLDPRMFKVNLIPYNPTDSPYEGSSPKAIEAFRAELERHGVGATVRLTRGRDIAAACGQLAAKAQTAAQPGRRPTDPALSAAAQQRRQVDGARHRPVPGGVGVQVVAAVKGRAPAARGRRARPPRRRSRSRRQRPRWCGSSALTASRLASPAGVQ